ncbi:hypothetical protein HJFPF1_10551 [Paramyrothecium foliicola]|nr:hypothetical protein HJFPF1_10551 [Paramyrothecium foliicola]
MLACTSWLGRPQMIRHYSRFPSTPWKELKGAAGSFPGSGSPVPHLGSLLVVDPKNYRVDPDGRPGRHTQEVESFYQAWLFFALINCVVRTDQSLLSFGDLVRPLNGRNSSWPRGFGDQVTTKSLDGALTKWYEYEENNKASARLRLVQADLILEFARQVVRANFPVPGVHENIMLSIMILGETLSAAKRQIMTMLKATVRGWQSDEDDGWGLPHYVTKEMRRRKFCPYTRKLLKVQMRSNSILLLAALNHHEGSENHPGCTEEKCVFIPASTHSTAVVELPTDGSRNLDVYAPQCHSSCENAECTLTGPNMVEVYQILAETTDATESSSFPLFRIRQENGSYSVEVETWSRKNRNQRFATISHVWAQGLGNEKTNEVKHCQLKFLVDQLEALPNLKARERSNFGQSGSSEAQLSSPFWLDTFAIPVKDDGAGNNDPWREFLASSQLDPQPTFESMRKKAIRQIYHVFDASSHSIVVDKDLCNQQVDNNPVKVSMKLLTSSWMRRLWTLQEAFLSSRMSIPFEATSRSRQSVREFDDLIKDLCDNESSLLKASMSEVLKRQLYDNLMGQGLLGDLYAGEYGFAFSHYLIRGLLTIVLQTTSRIEDQTLVLATLLNLNYKETEISQAGGLTAFLDPNSNEAKAQRQEMMKDFWKLINRYYEGSIPPGMIFLPPERLSLPGFGWSPVNWMSGVDEDYPFPLNQMNYPTELRDEGLLVRYPGIILHCGDFMAILNDMDKTEFSFPVDRELNEWYKVHRFELERQEVKDSIMRRRETDPDSYFAIIISRPRPRERVDEIGLLVQVYQSLWRRKEVDNARHMIHYCQIISRIKMCRTRPDDFKEPIDAVIGELTDEDQCWCVDDYMAREKVLIERERKAMEKELKKRIKETPPPEPTESAQFETVMGIAGQGPVDDPRPDLPGLSGATSGDTRGGQRVANEVDDEVGRTPERRESGLSQFMKKAKRKLTFRNGSRVSYTDRVNSS